MGPSSFLVKLFILLCALFSAQGDAGWSSDSDKSALLDLKSSLSDPYGVLSSWNLKNPDHCSWLGVSCDMGSRVIALNVTGGGNSLSCTRISQFPIYGFGIRRPCLGSNSKVKVLGTLSESIATLSELKILSMPLNELSGEIPFGIWGMEKLEVLDLEGNLISGSLPLQFGGLKNLRVLNLGFNEISSVIPSSLSNCVSLQVLNLAGNQVNGSIPGFIGRFRDLRGLYLSFNLLSGSIPSGIADNCEKLKHLELSGNYLTEGIPKSLGNCRELKTLLLYSNMLEEVIPSELGELIQLEVLDVSRNNFGGAIPPELGNCTKLSILVLSNLWDPLPNVSSFRKEKFASAADEFNFYAGTIPTGITNLLSLKMVWGPRAMLEGEFPSSWESCNTLEMLNLAQNYYSGIISDGFSNCKKLHFLDLSSNRLSGEIDDKIPVPCMDFFDVSGNNLTGSIPKFNYEACSPIRSMNWEFLEPYDPSAAYISYFRFRAQTETSLPFFEDSGIFPVLHSFGFNNFTGPLFSMPIAPAKLGSQTIYAFLAGNNKLTGTVPEALFEKCDQVRGIMVNVTGNELSGQLPADFGASCKSLLLFDVSNNQVTGFLPFGIGNFVSLVVLNLSWNNFQGSIPGSIGQIKDLKYLSLAGNTLDGPIPASIGQLYSLEVLELNSNSLSGEIPKEIANLKNLRVLLLSNNNLSGQLPADMANVSTLASFNASFNNLSGSLPVNDKMIKCNSFLGNPFLHCSAISLSPDPANSQGRIESNNSDTSSSSFTPSHKGEFNSIEIASITSASAIVSILLALFILFFYTRKCKPRSRVSGTSQKKINIFSDIGFPLTFENVVRAAGNFNASNCIGNGGFGVTYKAEIAPGVLVAIKRLSVGRFQGVQQFDAEIKTLGRLSHPNLVTLIGYHASETEMFLIYNFLSGGNLEKFIQQRSTRVVDWRVLHKISFDIARALAYLHDQCIPRVLHRDVKPSNILLDEDYNAYLSDFGLARLLGTSETHATTGVAGTFGYVAPEYATTCRVSSKADVYSYGVVLLELISDKKLLDPSFASYDDGFNIVAWACMLFREGRPKEFFTDGLWDAGPHDDLVNVLHLAVTCTDETLSTRPTMKDVVGRLKQLQPPSW